MMSRFGEKRSCESGLNSGKEQIYFAHAQCWMKERVPGGGGRPLESSASAKHLKIRNVQSCEHAERKRADESGTSRGGEIAAAKWRKERTTAAYDAVERRRMGETAATKASRGEGTATAEKNGASISTEEEGQSCGRVGACRCRCNEVYERECDGESENERKRARARDVLVTFAHTQA